MPSPNTGEAFDSTVLLCSTSDFQVLSMRYHFEMARKFTLPEELRNRLDEKIDASDAAILAQVQSVPESDLPSVADNVRNLIEKRIEGINYAEGRRNNIAVIAGVLIAAGTALLPAVFDKPIWFALLLGGLALCWVGAGMWVWDLYARQTNFKYPFIALRDANSHKWFYRGALGSDAAYKVSDDAKQSQPDYEQVAEAFAATYNEFQRSEVKPILDLREDLAQDLKHVFLLHVNEAYKNRFLSALRSRLIASLRFSAVAFIILFAAGVAIAIYLAHTSAPKQRASTFITDDRVEVTAIWEPIQDSLSGKDQIWTFKVHLKNYSQAAKSFAGLTFRDSKGRKLALEPISGMSQMIVGTQQESTYWGLFRSTGSDAKEIKWVVPVQ